MNKGILIGCALVSASILSWAFLIDGGHQRTRDLEQETQKLGDDVVQLEKETQVLKDKAAVLRDDEGDKAALEEVIREELGYVKSDEHILWLTENEP